LKLTLTL
jgi:transcription initiation factor TFIIE subunit beta